DLKGSAVMVQAMVFGNSGTTSGAGVAFSRDPSTGDADPVIDVLFEAQGEDVVSGRARPKTENELAQSCWCCSWSASTLSSKPGRTRNARCSSSFARIAASQTEIVRLDDRDL